MLFISQLPAAQTLRGPFPPKRMARPLEDLSLTCPGLWKKPSQGGPGTAGPGAQSRKLCLGKVALPDCQRAGGTLGAPPRRS